MLGSAGGSHKNESAPKRLPWSVTATESMPSSLTRVDEAVDAIAAIQERVLRVEVQDGQIRSPCRELACLHGFRSVQSSWWHRGAILEQWPTRGGGMALSRIPLQDTRVGRRLRKGRACQDCAQGQKRLGQSHSKLCWTFGFGKSVHYRCTEDWGVHRGAQLRRTSRERLGLRCEGPRLLDGVFARVDWFRPLAGR